jgi:hypothetical protein
MMKLQNELAIVSVGPPTDFMPERYTVIVFDRGEVGAVGTFSGDRAKGGNNGANPSPGETLLPVEPSVASRTVVIVKAATDTGAKDAIPNGQIPKFERLENGIFYGPVVERAEDAIGESIPEPALGIVAAT